MQADWRDGSLAEYMLAPVAAVTPADGLDSFDAAQLAVLNRFIVPFGGLLRGRLVAGEKLVVNGATGAFGTAAVRLGVAMGAARVVAAGRNQAALEAVVQVAGQRVVPVPLAGDVSADAASLRAAAGGAAEMAFDMVGQAGDANATLAALNSLRRGGRLVLMGSMTTPLPLSYSDVMRNDWEIIGQFHVSSPRLSPLDRVAAGRIAGYQRDPPAVFSACRFARGDGGRRESRQPGMRRGAAVTQLNRGPALPTPGPAYPRSDRIRRA